MLVKKKRASNPVGFVAPTVKMNRKMQIDNYVGLASVRKKHSLTVILIIGTFTTIFYRFERKTKLTGNQRKNQEYTDHIIAENG